MEGEKVDESNLSGSQGDSIPLPKEEGKKQNKTPQNPNADLYFNCHRWEGDATGI